MRLLLIPCSKSKRHGGTRPWSFDLTAASKLDRAGHSLWQARAALGALLDESPGPDLGSDAEPPPLLTADSRYNGRIYQAAGIDGWDRPTYQRFSDETFIVSALYGLLTPREPIRDYDCWMQTPLPTGETVGSWWRSRGMGRWLREYVTKRGIQDVYSFLSAEYEQSLDALTFDVGVRVHRVGGGLQSLSEQGAALARLVCTGACSCPRCTGTRLEQPTPPSVRAEAIGRALAQIPDAVYARIDAGEPEIPVLSRLSLLPAPYGILTGLALALSNYQLGPGGADRYWQDVESELLHRTPIGSLSDLRSFMADVMRHPSAARLAPMKLSRVTRLLASTLPGWLGDRSIEQIGQEPMALWERLSHAMNQAPDAKTVAFAMKIFDLLHRHATGRYLTFSQSVPIVVDLRIGRVSMSSGLIEPGPGVSYEAWMINAGERLLAEKGRVLSAWESVARHAGQASLFRIDSLIWQVAEGIYQHRRDRTTAADSVARLLEGYGSEPDTAQQIAAELTWAIPSRADHRQRAS